MPSLVTLHLHCVSTCRHRLYRPGISSSHRPRCRCCPLERVRVCLSSVTTSILIETLEFSPLPCYLSSCPTCPPPSYFRHPIISASLQFTPPPQYIIPTSLPTSSLSISLISISIYLSLYLSPLTHFLSPLSLNHSLSLSISPRPLSILASYSLSHFLLLNYPFSHYLFPLSLFSYSLSHTHTLSSLSRAYISPISVIHRKKINRGADSSHFQQLTSYTGMVISALYCLVGLNRLGSSNFGSAHSVLLFLSLLWNF